MTTPDPASVSWQPAEVTAPGLSDPVAVVAAKAIPYLSDVDRLQNLNIYLPRTSQTSALIDTPVKALPTPGEASTLPRYHVHVHGGAWRDPYLTADSIEPAIARAFSAPEGSNPLMAVASINYRISPFPTHPTLPYDAVKDEHSDPAREAVHPQHLSDVLHGLALLHSLGLTEMSYVLSGHSCGACLALQATLAPPRQYGIENVREAPVPAALLGLNGLYDLPALVDGLGGSHEHLRTEYAMLLANAFGADQRTWPAASPARFDPAGIAERVEDGQAPRLVVLDQSPDDQLVPMNQRDRLETTSSKVKAIRTVRGHRCAGKHAAPWEEGSIIWKSLQDIFSLLAGEGGRRVNV